MKRRQNKNWIAGSLAAVVTLALVCVVALPREDARPEAAPSVKQAEIETLPATQQQDAAEEADVPEAAEEVDHFGGMNYVPDVVLVTLPLGVSPAQAVETIVAETGLEGLALADGAESNNVASTGAEVEQRVELAVPEGVTVEEAIGRIGASSAVAAVQPNFIYYLSDDSPQERLVAQNYIAQDLVMQATANVNDATSEQWALESIYAYHTGTLSDASANYAWDVVQTNGAVGVAVIDEGFQADHPDLTDNVKVTYNATSESTDVSEIPGESGHGTHVAGIVSATANNGKGIAGVSYNAQLLLVKGATRTSSGKASFSTTDLANAFDYVIGKKSAYNVRVINMSIAGGSSSSAAKWADDTLIKAIDRAVNAGIVVVCSGGNSFTDANGTTWTPPYTCYPADYKNVVSVINLQENGNNPHNVSRSSNSNYNADSTSWRSSNLGKNISAPGTSMYSTMPSSAYNYKSGTSMASPVVAGALALAFAANPNLTVSQATSLLYTTATDIGASGWDVDTGYGEVNAYGLVSNAGTYLSGGTSVQVGKSITFTASAGGTSLVWATSDSSVATVSGGVVTGVAGGQVRITAGRVVSIFGFTSVIPIGSQVVTVYDPTISPSSSSVPVGGTTTLTMNCSQPGSWKWTSSDTSVATVTSSGSTVTVSGRKAGTATITATLNSNSNISTTARVTVNALSLNNATVSWPSSYTYNGSAQKPVPTVKVGSTTLAAGSDFTVTYPSDCTSAGTKSVTIKPGPSGRCSGSKTASYTIGQASIATATVTLSPSSYTYDGKAKTPSVTVKVGSRTLAQGTDYTVSWPQGRAALGVYQVTVVGKGNYTGSKSSSFTVSASRQPLYRLYRPSTGEHHYTLDAHERDVCVAQWGWRYEGVAWYCPNAGSTPVYRLYNRSSGLHHYTTDAYERDVCISRWGWTYEGIAWYSDDSRTVPLYRLYQPSSGHHHYTMDAHERDVCVAKWGWRYEGISWYGMR